MTIGAGYFVGFLVLFLYGCMCIYIGKTKQPTLFRITKLKVGRHREDAQVVKICYGFGAFTIVLSLIILVLGFVNA